MTSAGIGLIGAGRHGRRYAQHLREDIPGLHLAAVARRDPERARDLALELNVRVFTEWRELVESPEVEAVVVVVPPHHHEAIVDAAARHGKPVLLEKPAALDLAGGLRMLATVRRTSLPLLVAQTMRYNEIVRLLRAQRETIGSLYALRIGQHLEREPREWAEEPTARAGSMLHTGIHAFDLVRFLSGWEADRAWGEVATVGESRYENAFAAVFRLAGGRALASVSGSRATPSRSGAIEMVGERGQLVADTVFRTAFRIEGKTATPLDLPPEASTLREVLLDFAGVVRDGRPVSISLEEGLRAVALVEAVYAAARSGEAVAVPMVPER